MEMTGSVRVPIKSDTLQDQKNNLLPCLTLGGLHLVEMGQNNDFLQKGMVAMVMAVMAMVVKVIAVMVITVIL